MQTNDLAVVDERAALYSLHENSLATNDVNALVNFFWNSPLATRLGATENLHGFEEISSFRRSRPPASLARTIRRLEIVTFGSDHGQITNEFEREVERPTVSGRQSQSWVRFSEGWRIVTAHVPLIPLFPQFSLY